MDLTNILWAVTAWFALSIPVSLGFAAVIGAGQTNEPAPIPVRSAARPHRRAA